MRQLGLQLVLQKTCCYRPTTDTMTTGTERAFWESLGHLLLPGCGGVYILVAQKRGEGMTPLVSDWLTKQAPPLGSTVVKPSARARDDEVMI